MPGTSFYVVAFCAVCAAQCPVEPFRRGEGCTDISRCYSARMQRNLEALHRNSFECSPIMMFADSSFGDSANLRYVRFQQFEFRGSTVTRQTLVTASNYLTFAESGGRSHFSCSVNSLSHAACAVAARYFDILERYDSLSMNIQRVLDLFRALENSPNPFVNQRQVFVEIDSIEASLQPRPNPFNIKPQPVSPIFFARIPNEVESDEDWNRAIEQLSFYFEFNVPSDVLRRLFRSIWQFTARESDTALSNRKYLLLKIIDQATRRGYSWTHRRSSTSVSQISRFNTWTWAEERVKLSNQTFWIGCQHTEATLELKERFLDTFKSTGCSCDFDLGGSINRKSVSFTCHRPLQPTNSVRCS